MAWHSKDSIDRWFSLQKPGPGDAPKLDRIRGEAKAYALSILDLTPQNADQSAALRQLHQAMQTAISAIVCQKRGPDPVIPG